MTKEICKKITSGGTFSVDDLTPEEKKALTALFVENGMSGSTVYMRFFDKGFDQWELFGVTKLREEFLASTFASIDGSEDEEEGSKGYGYVLTLAPDYDDSKFYDIISQLKIGKRLCDFMAERGMASQMTVRTRFKANDWKPWELKGVNAILEEFVGKH